MPEKAKNHDTATEEDIIEVLTAISVVSRRLARNIMSASQHSQSIKGGKRNEQNSDPAECYRGCPCCCR